MPRVHQMDSSRRGRTGRSWCMWASLSGRTDSWNVDVSGRPDGLVPVRTEGSILVYIVFAIRTYKPAEDSGSRM